MRTALLLIFTLFLLRASAQNQNYQLSGLIGIPVQAPHDVAIDKNGMMYILERYEITKVDATGKYTGKIDISKNIVRTNNLSLELDKAGNLYVSDAHCNCVTKYSPEGLPLFSFEAYANGGNIALDANGNIYVTDYTNKYVSKFDMQGQFLQRIGASTSAGGTLNAVNDVGVDAQGNVYVLDSRGDYDADFYVHKFSSSGEVLQKFDVNQEGPGYNPNGALTLSVTKDGGFYIVYSFYREILQYGPDGALIRKFAGHGSHEAGLLGDYLNLSLDEAGNVYASDNHYSEAGIKKYSPEGNFLQKYGRDKVFMSPVYDTQGNLHLYDTSKNMIYVYDPLGSLKLKFSTFDNSYQYPERGLLALDTQGNIYLYEAGDNHQRVQKFSNKGVLEQRFNLVLPKSDNNIVWSNGFAIDKAGTLYIGDSYGGKIHKVDPTGKYIGTFGKTGTGQGEIAQPGSIVFDAAGFMYIQDHGGNRIQKFSPTGKFLMGYRDMTPNLPANFSNLSVDDDGNAFLSYSSNYSSSIKLYNQSGQLLQKLEILNNGIAAAKDGRLFAALLPDRTVGIYTSENYRQKNVIAGTIFNDQNSNCIKDEGEKAVAGVIVAAEPGPFYGVSDESGNYSISVDVGTYTVIQALHKEEGRIVSPTCSNSRTVNFSTLSNTARGTDFGNQVTLSPYLTTSVSSTRRRRCFESTTTISYTNSGFAAAEDAKVHLQLPEQVELLSADKPYTRLPNGTYVFEVGTLDAGISGTITIQDQVICGDESIRGLTVCTKAWITPINRSPTAPPAAVSTVTGTCDNNTGFVRFVIRNTGSADMEVGKQFRLYRDGQLSTLEDYRLAAGDSMVLRVPAMGKTVRLEADQPKGNGNNTLASATVEACSTVATRTAISTGFVNTMPTDDEEAHVAEECLPIIDSFDPNDKLVTPVGRTKEQYTPTGTSLKYKIRFQNTGTDVAYRVVVVDTLSEHLDLSTLQIGSASHNYIFSVSGKGQPVLTWTFNSIMLPDSTSNEPGSHGYIQFSIKPKADLPEKTAVENFADIFFDFNSPVRTNITLNRIFDMPPVIQEEHRLTPEEVIASPVITGFSPASGKFGSAVTLRGRNFSTVPEENKVWFHGTAATISSASATELQVLVPEGAKTGRVKVQTIDGATQSSDSYTVYQPPLITNLMPGEGVVGTEVRLQGSFLAEGGLESVQLGKRACQMIRVSDNEVIVRVPEQALTGNFLIQTKGGAYEHAPAFVVWHQPTISNLSKLTDKVGSEVEIEGEHFATAAQRNKVLIGQAQAEVLQASEARLKVRVPRGSTSGPVTVETPGGMATSAVVFEVIPAPIITEVTPGSGSVGTVVELKGFHFLTLGQQDTIYFGGTKALVLSASETKTMVRVPRGAKTGKVQVAGIGGVTSSTSDFVVEDLTPQQAIAVYPNPTTGKFTINFIRADFEVQHLEIVNTIGVKVFSHQITQEHQVEVNLTGLSGGIYLIKLTSSRGTITKKINLL